MLYSILGRSLNRIRLPGGAVEEDSLLQLRVYLRRDESRYHAILIHEQT